MYSGPDSNQWVKREQLTPPVDLSLNSGGNFGWDVAMDDSNTVFVGAPNQKTPDGEISGAVYTYKQVSVDSWGDPSDDVKYGGAAGDEFGWSVAANSEGFVVGAPDETVEGVVGAGAAHVFINDQTSYRLSNSAPETSRQFGFSVAMDQEITEYIVVGERNIGGVGRAYVYDSSDNSDSPKLESVEAGRSGIGFGSAVAMSGRELLVGAPADAGPDSQTRAGSTYYYHDKNVQLLRTSNGSDNAVLVAFDEATSMTKKDKQEQKDILHELKRKSNSEGTTNKNKIKLDNVDQKRKNAPKREKEKRDTSQKKKKDKKKNNR